MAIGYREPGVGYRDPDYTYRGLASGETPSTAAVGTPDIYRILIADLSNNLIAELSPKNLQFSFTLNAPGSVDFQLPLLHPKCTQDILDPGKRKIWVYREQERVWGGRLWYAGASSSEGHVRFSGEGYFSALRRRHVKSTKTYTAQDQLDIAWDLINYTQGLASGDLGISRSDTTYPSSITRTIKFPYWERANIGNAIEELAALKNGFDFEITPYGVWKTYYPRKGAVLTSITAEKGKNIRGIALEIDADNIASEVTALGGGEGKATCIAVYSDATSLATFGLLEEVVTFRNIKNYSVLQAKAQEQLRLHKGQRFQPQLALETNDPTWGDFTVGDEMLVKYQEGYFNINDTYRIIAMTVAVADEGNEVITLFFDEELVI